MDQLGWIDVFLFALCLLGGWLWWHYDTAHREVMGVLLRIENMDELKQFDSVSFFRYVFERALGRDPVSLYPPAIQAKFEDHFEMERQRSSRKGL